MILHDIDVSALTVCTPAGPLGPVRDLYVWDTTWSLAYVAVSVRRWLTRGSVLVPADRCTEIDRQRRTWNATLSRHGLDGALGNDELTPVSRYEEDGTRGYPGWPNCWLMDAFAAPGSGPWPTGGVIARGMPGHEEDETFALDDLRDILNPRLWSLSDLRSYSALAADGNCGRIDGAVFDMTRRAIAGLRVDLADLIPGKKVIVPVARVAAIRWEDTNVRLRTRRTTVLSAPPCCPDQPVTHEYLEHIRQHYDAAETMAPRPVSPAA